MDAEIEVSVRAAAVQRWAPVAATQMPLAAVEGERALVVPADATEAIALAFTLRRLASGWGSGDGAGEPAVAISSSGPGALGADLPGAILCAEEIWERAGEAWIEARPDPERAGVHRLGWQGPTEGAEAPGVALPRGVTVSLGRPRAMLGRERELAELAGAWKRAAGGSLSLELIAGEAGGGKTRLAAEAAREVHRAGGLVLHAGPGEGTGAPYAPFVDAFAPLLDAGADRELAGSLFGRVLDPSGVVAGAGAGGLGDERAPIFRSAIEQLERLTAQSPILLIAEDLHAWGPSSLQLLEHVCRLGAGLRLMVVATYRPTDLRADGEPGSPAAALGRLREVGGAVHTELGGLGIVPLRGIAAACGLVDSRALERAAELALAETAGNPLFALELLGSLGEDWRAEPEGGPEALPAPRSLQMLIVGRARGLGADAFRHLSAASVAVHLLEPGLLAEVVESSYESVSDSLARAARAGLVAPAVDGRYAFTHALTARCLYSELEPVDRGELHRRYALALERRRDAGAERADRLARHWRRAAPADPARELRWAQEAGRQALSRYDHGAAAEWFERALELEGSGSEGRRRCELLIGLGTALRYRGGPRFRELLLEAARLAAELGETELLVEAVLANNRGFPSSIGEYDHERVAMLELALERMPESPERAVVLAQLALELTFSRQLSRRHELARGALEAARASGDERILSRILIRAVIARWGPDNARERIARAAESISISSRLDEPLDLFHGLHWQGAAQLEVQLVEDWARNLRTQARIAARLGDATALWLTACSESLRVALRGRLEEAEGLAMEAMALGQDGAQPDALPFFASQIAGIRWQQGRLVELMPILLEALENHPGLPAFRSLLALGHALAGDRAAGREVVDSEAASDFGELPLDPVWLAAIVTYAHAVAELGDATHAPRLEQLLTPFSGRLATTSVSVWGTVDHALGRLAAVRGDGEAAERHLARALADYTRISAPVWRGHALLDRARAGLALGADPASVEPLLAEARAIGRRHGAGLLVQAVDERRQEREQQPRASAAVAERLGELGLTERQSQVVDLLARGHSNAAIAARLEISPSTVKRHLENIFAEVGVGGRGELIALLLRPEDEDPELPAAGGDGAAG